MTSLKCPFSAFSLEIYTKLSLASAGSHSNSAQRGADHTTTQHRPTDRKLGISEAEFECDTYTYTVARAQANIYHLGDCKPSTTEINVVCKVQATSRCLPPWPARVAIEHLATAVVIGHLMGCVRLTTPATFTTHQY